MTDEEKTKEYAEDYKTKDGRSLDYCDIEKAYLDGLAEGEKIGKEKQWKATEKAQKKTSAKIKELEKENAELESDLESEARAAGELESQVDALEEELQAERYMLKCRDDELAEARAELSMAETQRNMAEEELEKIEQRLNEVCDELEEVTAQRDLLDQKLRRAETKLRLVLSDFLALKPAFYIGYGDELEKRAQEKEALEDLCDKEREEKMRQEAEEEKRHVND